MSPTISLTEDDSERISTFIEEMLDAGKTSKTDDFEEAYTRGKGAEVAVARFLNDSYNTDCEVDFDVYEGSDSTDLPPFQCEVKVLPSYGQWCAIPARQFSQIDQDEPIILVKGDSDSEQFEIAGWTMPADLFVIEQGVKPFTQYGDNYCKRIDNCSTDWDSLVEQLTGEPVQRQQGTHRGGENSGKRFDFQSTKKTKLFDFTD